MENNKIEIIKLNITAMMVAIEFILTRYLKIMIGGSIRISFGFLPMVAVAILYGPLWAGISFAVSDVLGATLVPIGFYHPGFTISAFLKGIIFGIILHKRCINWKNITVACFISVFGVNLILDTVWLSQILDKGVFILLPARLIKCLVMFPIEVVLIHLAWNHMLIKIPYVQALRREQMQNKRSFSECFKSYFAK